MRLSRIFVDQTLDEGAQIQLDSDSSHYVKNVLRLKHDATILLFNGKDLFDYKSQLCYEGKKALARSNIKALMTKVNKPRVKILIGSVSKIRIGRTKPFRMARTMAMEMASVNTLLEPSLTMLMPGIIQAMSSSDRPSTTVMTSKRISD